MPRPPLRIAFLGCGFITRVHSRHLRSLRADIVCSYASRDAARAEELCRRYGGAGTYREYAAAIADPGIDAVVIAVPPRFHLELTLQALQAGKHVVVEKPAFLRMEDYETVLAARNRAARVVLVGENDHYKPLAVTLRKLLAAGAIGDMVFGHFSSIVKRLKSADDWRNDETMAGGDAFFEEGIHWLHLAGSLGPTITTIQGYRPAVSREGPDTRAKSMMVAFRYDNEAVGSLYYSREIPVTAARAPAVEAVRPEGHHHLRVERRLRARPRTGPAAAVVSRVSRHSRIPGDVPGLRARDPRGTGA